MVSRTRFTPDWAVTGDTQGAANLVKATGALDIAQGSEAAVDDADVIELIGHNTQVILDGSYNEHAGGSREVRELVARDFRDSFRMDVGPDQVYFFNQSGRSTIEEAYKVAAEGPGKDTLTRGSYPAVLLPNLRWGVLTPLAKKNNIDVLEFDHFNPNLTAEVEAEIRKDPKRIGAVLVNFPHNPTALEKTREQMLEFMTMLDRVNAEFGTDIHAIFDTPYAFGCEQGIDARGRYLKTGFEDVLDNRWATKWLVSRTVGKELGLSQYGVTVVATSKNYPIKNLAARCTENGKGLGYNARLVRNVAEFLGNPANDEVKWRHRASLRDKYNQDSGLLRAAFPGNVVAGGPNTLLELLEFRKGDLLGRQLTGDTGAWDIQGGRDLVTYLGNEHGVVPVWQVFNGASKADSLLVRAAKKLRPADFGEAIQRLQRGLCAVSGKSVQELALDR